jgi:hypothetical protein
VKRSLLWAPLALLALGGCPKDNGNADVLWLAPNGSEVIIQLIDHEPPPW